MTTNNKEEIRMEASIPDIQSAIKIGQLGMRLTLDIPESSLAAAVQLLKYRGCAIEVKISEL